MSRSRRCQALAAEGGITLRSQSGSCQYCSCPDTSEGKAAASVLIEVQATMAASICNDSMNAMVTSTAWT